VEFQVEKHAGAPIDERADESRALEREQATANLEAAGNTFECVGELGRTLS
jgi:hypothetical protein